MSEPTWDHELASRAESWRSDKLTRELKLAAGGGVRFDFQGRRILSFASNDYLGLSSHPQVIAAAKAALDAYGAGAGASPLICGHKTPHAALEAQLAAFKRSAAALVFASGYQAALATIAALADEDATIIADRLAHASLLDGAKLSGARVDTSVRVRVFKHNDAADLARLLHAERSRRCLILAETLYSMDGDTAPVPALVALAAERHALLLLDEAHATGVLGATGRGLLEAECRDGLPAHVIAMGTLSKALGSQGGFICASRTIVQTVVQAGRAYMFSTALSPAAAAAAGAALRLIDAEPQRRVHLQELSAWLRTELARRGARVVPGEGPIIPVLCGGEELALQRAQALFETGVLVPAVRYPTVKRGQARLRISLSAAHSRQDCETLLANF